MKDAVTTILLLAIYFFVFACGVTVESAKLDPNHWYFEILFTLSYTATNVGILTLVASLIGDHEDWIEALKRGFTTYLILLSGTVVLFTESLTNPTQAQYGKLAASFSMLAILTSYKPEIFQSLLDRVSTFIQGKTDDQNGDVPDRPA